MKVSELMTPDVAYSMMNQPLSHAAQLMWQRDCGCVPIVDDERRVVGMLTDRDICMAALSRGAPIANIPVGSIASTNVISVSEEATVEAAEALMQRHQLRRLPVHGRRGELRGIISMNDLARRMQLTTAKPSPLSGDVIAHTLAAISRPHALEATA